MEVTRSYMTSVARFDSGKEQRMACRSKPRVERTIRVVAEGSVEGAVLASSLELGLGAEWMLPCWEQSVQLGVDLTLGATELDIDPAPFDYEVGGYVVLYLDPDTWEVLEVTGLAGGKIQVTVTEADWPYGAIVAPCVEHRMASRTSVERVTGDTYVGSALFVQRNVILYGVS